MRARVPASLLVLFIVAMTALGVGGCSSESGTEIEATPQPEPATPASPSAQLHGVWAIVLDVEAGALAGAARESLEQSGDDAISRAMLDAYESARAARLRIEPGVIRFETAGSERADLGWEVTSEVEGRVEAVLARPAGSVPFTMVLDGEGVLTVTVEGEDPTGWRRLPSSSSSAPAAVDDG